MNNLENIQRKENYNQVCVWPGTIVGEEEEINTFEEFMLKKFKVRIQYLEEIKTLPDKGVEGTGDRNDVFFAVHDKDVGKFSIPRLAAGIRWVEDVLEKHNYKNQIYPKRVFKYKTW